MPQTIAPVPPREDVAGPKADAAVRPPGPAGRRPVVEVRPVAVPAAPPLPVLHDSVPAGTGPRSSPPPAGASPAAASAPAGGTAASVRPPATTTTWLLECVAVLLQPRDAQDPLRALVVHIAASLRCQRVALALQDGRGTLRVVAVSDLPRPQDAPDFVADLLAAAHDVQASGCTLVHPAVVEAGRHPSLGHVQLGRSLGGSALCSAPLADGGQVHGVLTLQRDAAEPFGRHEAARFELVCAFLAPLLRLQAAAGSSARPPAGGLPRWMRAVRRHAWTLAAVAALAAAAVPVPHSVAAAARVHGVQEWQLAAPRDGFIASVGARPGSTVRSGDALVVLDDESARQELRTAQATLDQAESAFGEAMARGEQGQVVVQVARIEEAAARVEAARQALARGRLVAPDAGIVVDGDLTRSIGAPVQRGQVLMTLAPADGHRVALWVDERDIARVRVGQAGLLRLASQPGEPVPVEVVRLTPLASVRDGRNGFEVEARPVSQAASLRPGFEGVARLEDGQAPLGWVLLHRAWHAVRLGWWSVAG